MTKLLSNVWTVAWMTGGAFFPASDEPARRRLLPPLPW